MTGEMGSGRLGVHVPGRCGVPGSGHLSPGPMLAAFPGAWQDGCVPPRLLLGGITAAWVLELRGHLHSISQLERNSVWWVGTCLTFGDRLPGKRTPMSTHLPYWLLEVIGVSVCLPLLSVRGLGAVDQLLPWYLGGVSNKGLHVLSAVCVFHHCFLTRASASGFLQKRRGIQTSLMVQWLRIHLPMQGMWVQSLVVELRSHMQWGN